MALVRVIASLMELCNSVWNALNHSRSASFSGLSSRFSTRPTIRAKITATSFAQLSQYFLSPHLSTIFGEYRFRRNIDGQKHLLTLQCAFTVTFTAEDNPIGERFVEVNSVDFGVESIVRGNGERVGHPTRLRSVHCRQGRRQGQHRQESRRVERYNRTPYRVLCA